MRVETRVQLLGWLRAAGLCPDRDVCMDSSSSVADGGTTGRQLHMNKISDYLIDRGPRLSINFRRWPSRPPRCMHTADMRIDRQLRRRLRTGTRITIRHRPSLFIHEWLRGAFMLGEFQGEQTWSGRSQVVVKGQLANLKRDNTARLRKLGAKAAPSTAGAKLGAWNLKLTA
jgi:hypothetical protein